MSTNNLDVTDMIDTTERDAPQRCASNNTPIKYAIVTLTNAQIALLTDPYGSHVCSLQGRDKETVQLIEARRAALLACTACRDVLLALADCPPARGVALQCIASAIIPLEHLISVNVGISRREAAYYLEKYGPGGEFEGELDEVPIGVGEDEMGLRDVVRELRQCAGEFAPPPPPNAWGM